ncbi:MAG: hypothetical protein ACREI9_05605 [Nitrospiraceae bacterium]
MFNCIYRISDGQFLDCGPCEQVYNPMVEGMVQLPSLPDQRLHRYDGAGGKRNATGPEIAAFDAAATDDRALSDVEEKAFKAMAAVLRTYCNSLLAGTYTNKSVANVRADLIAAWKALP